MHQSMTVGETSPNVFEFPLSMHIIHLIFLSSPELRSCVKVEVVVLGSTSLIVLKVSVDVKQHLKKKCQVQTSSPLSCGVTNRKTIHVESVIGHVKSSKPLLDPPKAVCYFSTV